MFRRRRATSWPPLAGDRRHVVQIAYSCEPGAGSERGVGWHFAMAAAGFADVTLITATSAAQADTDKAVAESGLPIRVHWVDDPVILGGLLRGKALALVRYCLFQARAARALRRYERETTVDAVHHVTWASDSLPSAVLASRAPVRVWGPVGGCTRTSAGLYRFLTPRGVAAELVRDVVNGAFRTTTGRWAARRATLIAALNQDVQRYWTGRCATPVVLESNIALGPCDLEGESDEGLREEGGRVAVFVGRLIPWKGLLLALEVLSRAPGWRLVVFGEGPDRRRAEARAQRLGVLDRVQFRGEVPRQEVLAAFRTADAFLFPSFHDSASWAAGEAAALGCPVVCLDTGGPALQAGPNGYVVPVQPERSLPDRISERLQSLPGRGVPYAGLNADRLPAVLASWYSGQIA